MPASLETLKMELRDPSVEVRLNAAEALARMGEEARPAAVALVAACGDVDSEVRDWATAALEGMGPPSSDNLKPLIDLLHIDNPLVAYWAATLLGRLEDAAADAVDALVKSMRESTATEVRQRSAWALGRIGPAAKAAIPALQKAAGDRDPRLSQLAQTAIDQIQAK